MPGVPWHTQILADQLTLFHSRGTDYAHLITTGTPEFLDSDGPDVEPRFFWATMGTGGLEHLKFLIFDGKQHPEKIWFRGC